MLIYVFVQINSKAIKPIFKISSSVLPRSAIATQAMNKNHGRTIVVKFFGVINTHLN